MRQLLITLALSLSSQWLVASLQAVRELFDNMVFIGDALNASEGHIYIRETDMGKDPRQGSEQSTPASPSLLTLRDNGVGMTIKTWRERASRICRAADSRVGYTPELAQTLSRFGGTLNPPKRTTLQILWLGSSSSC